MIREDLNDRQFNSERRIVEEEEAVCLGGEKCQLIKRRHEDSLA
jgi:hypothetical protein